MKKSELISLIKEVLSENRNLIFENVQVSDKDWSRMADLVLKGDNGQKVAKLITDKNKAIARFVAGVKLYNKPIKYYKDIRKFGNFFDAIGDRALELGATLEEIQAVFDATEVPEKFNEKIKNLSEKNLSDRFVGDISKAVLDMGFDITYLKHNGNALTWAGNEAMSRNGRKWTIGYKSQIKIKDQLLNFSFDAITDEGDGPAYYTISHSLSDKEFYRLDYGSRPIGKNKFISELKDILRKYAMSLQ